MENGELVYGTSEYKRAERFQRLRKQIQGLWQDYYNGTIKYKSLMKELKHWMVRDYYLTSWTMGNDDHVWYRFNEDTQEWEEGTPPIALETLDEISRKPPRMIEIDDSPISFSHLIGSKPKAPNKPPESHPTPRSQKDIESASKQRLREVANERKRMEDSLEQFLRLKYPDENPPDRFGFLKRWMR